MSTPLPDPRSLPPTPEQTPPADAQPGTATATAIPLTEEQVWDVLHTCYDPEIPVNIVDLGLVYDVLVQGNRVDVKMTLTAPGCHLGGQIAADVQSKLLSLGDVEEANVELVWDPPWHQSMITAAGRRILGLD